MKSLAKAYWDQQEENKKLKEELSALRVGVARLAQAAGVNTAELPITADTDFATLLTLARTQERGWSRLVLTIWKKLLPETF